MKRTINESDFINAFKSAEREEQFTKAGLKALFQMLEDLEIDTGEEYELDVIGLCVDFNEISREDIKKETGCEDFEDLNDQTLVVEVNDETIIYQCF